MRGDWTYYGAEQGLSEDVQDVSPDEGGNVYVAGGDALYVKRRADQKFLRFDAGNAGLTKNCNDVAEISLPTPTKPFWQCRILAVAGAEPGKAIIGYEGFGHEAYASGWDWVLSTGGADVVRFDSAAGTLSRTRHVFIASPPHVVCAAAEAGLTTTAACPPGDWAWETGRRLCHKIRRIVVNHDRSSPMYGDAWLGGEHGTFSALFNNAAARGYVDRTAGWPGFEDAKDVWEHLHPNVALPAHPDWFINGEGWALSLDPRDGKPWGSNEYRTAYVAGYGPNLAWDQFGLGPWTKESAFIDVWPDGPDFSSAQFDAVRSMSHCPDGTVWIGSTTHGLARIAPDETVSYPPLPANAGAGVSAVACDPADGSVWIGLQQGGVTRLRGGVFEPMDATGLPAYARHPVANIQMDRWSSPRVVYFAFAPLTDASGQVVEAGGVGAFHGP